MSALLNVENVEVRYDSLVALSDASMTVDEREILCLLGPNGSGKSTLVNSIAGLTPLSSGEVRLQGDHISDVPAHARVAMGISLVPERRRLFPNMTLYENLTLGAVSVDRQHRREFIDMTMDLFPLLNDRRNQIARSFSGGEQQLIAIARGLVSRPRLLMIDEPFLGLSPSARSIVRDLILRAKDEIGCAVLFIEQEVRVSLDIAHRAFFLNAGRIVATGDSDEFSDEARVRRLYIGV